MKALNRKEFLKKGLLGAAGAGLLTQTACQSVSSETDGLSKSDKVFNWRMVTTWPPNFPILGEGCNFLAEWITEMSGGRLNIQVFGSGELVPGLECFDAVSNGAIEMGHGAAYYWAGKVPAALFFASVPFGMNAQQMNAWMLTGGGQELWRELYAPFNLVPFVGGNTGVQMGGWFNREIKTIDDLKGLKMRIPGIGGKVFARAGGSAISVAGGEIYTNLERGVIDATEWIGPFHDYKMGFHEIAKYYYYPGWHEAGTSLETLVNKDKFEELPGDLQAIVETAIMRQNHWILSAFEARNAEYLEIIRNESGADFRPFPKDVMEKLKEYTQSVVEELAASSPEASKIYQAFDSFRKRAAQWSEVSEKIYYTDIQTI